LIRILRRLVAGILCILENIFRSNVWVDRDYIPFHPHLQFQFSGIQRNVSK
jgi:hypothetical protein